MMKTCLKYIMVSALLLSITGLIGISQAQEDAEEEDIESHLQEQQYFPGVRPRPSIYPSNTKPPINNPSYPTSSPTVGNTTTGGFPPPNSTTGGYPGGNDCSAACGIAGSRACQRCLENTGPK